MSCTCQSRCDSYRRVACGIGKCGCDRCSFREQSSACCNAAAFGWKLYTKRKIPLSASNVNRGYVRLLCVTDKQFGDMVSLYGKEVKDIEEKPEQLLLF